MSEKNKKSGLSAVFGAASGFLLMPVGLAAGATSLLTAGNAGLGENLNIGLATAVAFGAGYATKEAGRYISRKVNENHSDKSFSAGAFGGFAACLIAGSIAANHYEDNINTNEIEPKVIRLDSPDL
ncbi:MAG: hypothetical protein ACLFR0_08465 [Alphaproteobacteria bacterium]